MRNVRLMRSPIGLAVLGTQCFHSELVRPRMTSRSPWPGWYSTVVDLSSFEPPMIFANLNGRVAPRGRLGIVGSASPKSLPQAIQTSGTDGG